MLGDAMDCDWKLELQRIYAKCQPFFGRGTPANYIPELAIIDPKQFGISLHTLGGQSFGEGDVEVPFSIQSISKVLVLAMVMPRVLPNFDRVHVEPSGDPFNSLIQLEYEQGIPRNPFINAGALVTTDLLMSFTENPVDEMLNFISILLGGETVAYNKSVAISELKTAGRNRALAHLMQSFGNIKADVELLLDVYCRLCSIELTLSQLTRAFAFLVRAGSVPGQEKPLLTSRQTKRINALMLTCGFYDESGEFAFRVGLPGKSGVGGGIIAVLPGQFSIGTWSPGLNDKGNSLVGMRALELFTDNTRLSLF